MGNVNMLLKELALTWQGMLIFPHTVSHPRHIVGLVQTHSRNMKCSAYRKTEEPAPLQTQHSHRCFSVCYTSKHFSAHLNAFLWILNRLKPWETKPLYHCIIRIKLWKQSVYGSKINRTCLYEITMLFIGCGSLNSCSSSMMCTRSPSCTALWIHPSSVLTSMHKNTL